MKIIRGHLYESGFSLGYLDWIWHGEGVASSTKSSVGSTCPAKKPTPPSETYNVCQETYNDDEDWDNESDDFKRYVVDADQPLFEGSECTKLEPVLILHNWKARFGVSDKAFIDLLELVGSFLPKEHVLPGSMYEAKKTITDLGLEYVKIHACPNDCVLYRGPAAESLSECPKCHLSRWKIGKDGEVRVNVPAKVMWYFLIIPRFKRLFKSAVTAKLMSWHAENRSKDGKMRQPSDSPAWRNVDCRWPEFGSEARNIRLGLAAVDVMHIEKNVCDNIIGTLLNMKYKTKDSIASRLDITDMGVRTDLAPEIVVWAEVARLPYPTPAVTTVVDVSKLSKLQADLILTLCELEKIFPLSFFDVMVHLTIHLVRELRLCGPVFYRWMFPFERFNKILKSYVRNRFYPEGCIAEGYLKEESVEFCTGFFSESSRTAGLQKDDDKFSGPVGRVTMKSVAEKERDEAHLVVLLNNPEVEPYIRLHKEHLKRIYQGKKKSVQWLLGEHNRQFPDWFQQKVSIEMRENSEAVSETIRWLTGKPSFLVLTYEGYIVDGVRYHTKERDNARDKFASVDKVSQVFYVEDPCDANWSVVLSSTTRDYHDVYNEDVEEETSWNPPPFCDDIPMCDPTTCNDDASVSNKRQNVEGIWVKKS
ncbi:uncharacterized protein LOC141702039 [Apium graveolens]|uniref:uncharacterized protein LOC141702039 n=1 Tax=Apium graveolens TaxID=4045 RepID=UPI003D79970B